MIPLYQESKETQGRAQKKLKALSGDLQSPHGVQEVKADR